jgi:hypothetical protein
MCCMADEPFKLVEMPLKALIRPHDLKGITDLKLRFNWRLVGGEKTVVLEDQGVDSSSTI